jgi:hypothetical protein
MYIHMYIYIYVFIYICIYMYIYMYIGFPPGFMARPMKAADNSTNMMIWETGIISCLYMYIRIY